MPFDPVQEPDAAQLVALDVLHVNCDADPDCTLAGDAVRVSTGALDVTVTVAVRLIEPLAPEHASV